jgi:glycosyltransferase involved in cell wall biosynthesis
VSRFDVPRTAIVPVSRTIVPPSPEGLRQQRRLRVLFLSWRDLAHPRAGGSEVLVDSLIGGLRARGHSAALVCGGPVGRRPYPALSAGGTYDHYLRAPLVARRFRHWDLLVDVVNGFPYFSPLWWTGPKLCFFHHVHGEQWARHFPRPVAAAGDFIESSIVPRLYRRTRFAAPSPSTAAALEALGVAGERIHLVHNGIDGGLFDISVPESADPLFVVLGRLAPNKGINRVLDAWARVHPVVGGRLVVVGEGPERKRLEARALPGVEFVGRVTHEQKIRLLGSAWLLVHGAHQEGWGIVVIEAAALSTPALAYDAEGLRDSIVDGITGELVNDEEAMVRSWIALAGDPAKRSRLAGAARLRSRAFSHERSVEEFLSAARATIGARQ